MRFTALDVPVIIIIINGIYKKPMLKTPLAINGVDMLETDIKSMFLLSEIRL